jgi:hypothetical protein
MMYSTKCSKSQRKILGNPGYTKITKSNKICRFENMFTTSDLQFCQFAHTRTHSISH